MRRILKSRIVAVSLMASSLFVMAASAQPRADRIRVSAEVVVQDDIFGSFLLIDVKTGQYKFQDCTSNFTMGGFLKVDFSGCKASVKDESEGRLVVADIDLCSGQARAYLVLEAFDGPIGPTPPAREYTINDSNIRDSIADCKAAEK
jgi:hypothetical protein